MRDVLEPRIGGDRSHRSRWWLPRRSIEWDWNVLSLGATAKISSGRPDPARRPGSPPSNCLSNHFPPSFYSQKNDQSDWGKERSFYGDYENARDGREGVFVCVSVCVGSWKWRRGCVIRERNSTFPNFMRSLWNLEFVLFLSLSFFLSFFLGLIRYSNRLFLFFYSFTLPYVEVIKTFLSKNSQKSKVI